MKTDTPKTDAEAKQAWLSATNRVQQVPADFARKLERELREAQAQLQWFMENQNQIAMDVMRPVQEENARLRERERLCETMDKAEKLALIRALQEIRDEVGLIGDGVSPRQIVEAVKIRLSNVSRQRPLPAERTPENHNQRDSG
jgi:hypothetical protein